MTTNTTAYTDRKQTEDAPAAKEKKFRDLFENSPDAIFVEDLNGEVLDVNPAACRLHGTQRETLIGRNVLELIPPDKRTEAARDFAMLARGDLDHLEGFSWVENCRAVPVEIRVSHINYDNKSAMLLHVRDITEHKQVEEALREARERFLSAFENAPNGMALVSINGSYLQVNRALCELLGHTEAELLGTSFQAITYPDDLDVDLVHLHAMLKGEHHTYQTEKRYLHADGHVVWALLSTALITDTRGQPMYFVSHIQDISERKRAEEQLRRHSEELEELVAKRAARIQELERQRMVTEKLAATGRMAARIAHEINNPLAGIRNALRLVGRAVPKDHRYYHYVGKIEKEIARIAQIVHQMLNLYRPDQLSKQEFRVDESIRDVVALMRSGSDQRRIKLELDTDSATNMVRLPENRLRQILYNLIQNALDASPQGSSVRIRAIIDRQCLTITVSDQGDGIPEEARPHIFEPFFTTKIDLATGGLGLGLSVCKSLVEAMNGSIAFESKLGKGSEFRVILPLAKNGLEEGKNV
ncbi:PAS domain S-box protein [candidate division KSB1 bacterium]|nr:PAS domain S-box protein [candidate division KSB1 bacterium]